MTPWGTRALYLLFALLISLGLVLAVNGPVNSQNDILRQNLATSRALACTLTLPIGPDGRDPVQAAACWTQEGLRAPKIP